MYTYLYVRCEKDKVEFLELKHSRATRAYLTFNILGSPDAKGLMSGLGT